MTMKKVANCLHIHLCIHMKLSLQAITCLEKWAVAELAALVGRKPADSQGSGAQTLLSALLGALCLTTKPEPPQQRAAAPPLLNIAGLLIQRYRI